VASQTLARSEPHEWSAAPTESHTVSYQTQRQRVLTPGDISHLPYGNGLLLTPAGWQLIGLTPWHLHEPWRTIATA
jgi:hypothetical protein